MPKLPDHPDDTRECDIPGCWGMVAGYVQFVEDGEWLEMKLCREHRVREDPNAVALILKEVSDALVAAGYLHPEL